MFWRWKKNETSDTDDPQHQRKLYRAPTNPDMLRAVVLREEEDAVHAGICDLSLEGAGLEIPFHLDPGFEEGEVVNLEMRHIAEDWQVDTPAVIERSIPNGGANVRYGITFMSMGRLYAQMESTLARYFNRRQHPRVTPELDKDIGVRLKQGGHKPLGSVHDLSQGGMCVALDLVSSAPITSNQTVTFAFDLPGFKHTLEGTAKVLGKRRLGLHEFLSLEFELEAEDSLVEHFEALNTYVKRRVTEMEAFSDQLRATGTDG